MTFGQMTLGQTELHFGNNLPCVVKFRDKFPRFARGLSGMCLVRDLDKPRKVINAPNLQLEKHLLKGETACGLYYKCITIVIDAPSVISK